MDDPYQLDRFVDAQRTSYDAAIEELRAGEKRGHWMWFIFPQVEGLGSSPTSQFYAIKSREEGDAYLAHPVLGPRLRACAEAVNEVQRRSAHEIFGSPDDLKFHSSMTLFAQLAPDNAIFENALRKYFNGSCDPVTLRKLDGL
ncbi:DUF1810 domain-containing protein [Phenylobacterium sp.]|jgi:uncharacterized protein (DUF1810 family)|uniref:DUF1810 domain-containing protein n=1 Tax=Phenylobacterium sp. TaxID=1871053 RepID=UPI002E340C35|nr:DUF1810 domain-containing protein [Phenylobacterium sp.]HEX4711146.1 DUF1810 domain-containing protein [Phenylobacterium sp.]